MSADESEPEYGLVMPSLLAKSNGGPFDDTALTAGVYLGEIHETLSRGDDFHRYVPPVVVPQVDLFAMHYGYTMVSEPWDEFPDEWTLLTLSKGGQ